MGVSRVDGDPCVHFAGELPPRRARLGGDRGRGHLDDLAHGLAGMAHAGREVDRPRSCCRAPLDIRPGDEGAERRLGLSVLRDRLPGERRHDGRGCEGRCKRTAQRARALRRADPQSLDQRRSADGAGGRPDRRRRQRSRVLPDGRRSGWAGLADPPNVDSGDPQCDRGRGQGARARGPAGRTRVARPEDPRLRAPSARDGSETRSRARGPDVRRR